MNRENIQTRVAQLSDIPFIVPLVNSAYRGDTSKSGWTTEAELLDGQRTDESSLYDIISGQNAIILLFTMDNQVEPIGCVLLENKKSSAYLGMFSILPTLQNSGLGKTFLSLAQSWCVKNWNSKEIEISVIAQRKELIAWYQRRGFVANGETLPFPYGDEKFGIPKRDDLYFIILIKQII